MSAWMYATLLPWLLERIKEMLDPAKAKAGGNTVNVILILFSVILATLLATVGEKAFDLNSSKIQAEMRLEAAQNDVNDLKADKADLEQEIDTLQAALQTPVSCVAPAVAPTPATVAAPVTRQVLPHKRVGVQPRRGLHHELTQEINKGE